MLRFASRLAVLSTAALVAACASTASGGGEADTSTTTQDTAGGGKDTASGQDTSTGGDTVSGSTVTIAQIREANKTCGSAGTDPQNFGDQKGVTVENVVVATPWKKANTEGTLFAVFVQSPGGGQYSGLYVVGTADAIKALKVGDKITVQGDVKDFYCQSQIYSKTITVVTAGVELATATTVTQVEVGEKATREQNEAFEGVLISVDNVVMGGEALSTQGKPVGNYFVGADENDNAIRIGSDYVGVYLTDKVGDTYPLKYPKGTKFGRLQGIYEYGFGQYRLTLTKDPTGIVKP